MVGLHQAPYHPDDWYILQGCSGSVYGGQVVGLLGPSGECACMQRAGAQLRAGQGLECASGVGLLSAERLGWVCWLSLRLAGVPALPFCSSGARRRLTCHCRLRQDHPSRLHCRVSHGPGQLIFPHRHCGGGWPQVGGCALAVWEATGVSHAFVEPFALGAALSCAQSERFRVLSWGGNRGCLLLLVCRRRKSQVAYVPQSDVLIPSLTVQECLRYSALLRLPPDTSPLALQVG